MECCARGPVEAMLPGRGTYQLFTSSGVAPAIEVGLNATGERVTNERVAPERATAAAAGRREGMARLRNDMVMMVRCGTWRRRSGCR